jgi:Mrp family chromosome partitioning ATPase
MPGPERSVVSVFSARPDGATSIAAGLAAVLSRTARVLLIDLCAHGPEVAPLLDVEDSPNVYELSFLARLTPVSASDLEAQVQWRDGVGVLAGNWPQPEQREEITDVFVEGLMTTAASRFDHVIVDLGRPRATLPPALAGGVLLWVVTPSPLGMAALDRTVASLHEQEAVWLSSAKVVLNRVDERSWRDVERFIELEYRMPVVAQVPLADECWRALEKRHSLAPFCVPAPDRKRHQRDYGSDAWRIRQALEDLAQVLLPERPAVVAAALEV